MIQLKNDIEATQNGSDSSPTTFVMGPTRMHETRSNSIFVSKRMAVSG